jgi:uncharacterized protein involved in exopolysaccharide biosynthesis
MTPPEENPIEEPTAHDQRESDLLDMAIALGEEKQFIARATVSATLVALVACFAWPSTYTAKTVLLPPQSSQNIPSNMLGALGALSSAGLNIGTTIKSPDELYVSLLKSRTVTDALISQFGLEERYGKSTLTDTRRELADKVLIAGEKRSGLITVEVEDHDPKFSAELANAYAVQLRQLMTRVAVTEAQQRRVYLEQQVERSKEELEKAENAFQKAQEKSGLLSIDVAAQSAIHAAAQLRAQITSLEIELRSMSAYAAPGNPDIQRKGAELSSLRKQLEKVEGGTGATTHLTEVGLANIRAYRALKYQEAILGSMVALYETARAEEAKEAPLVQQVDVAVTPDERSGPRRALIVMLVVAISLFASAAISLIRRAWRSVSANDDATSIRSQLVRAWSIRRRGQ